MRVTADDDEESVSKNGFTEELAESYVRNLEVSIRFAQNDKVIARVLKSKHHVIKRAEKNGCEGENQGPQAGGEENQGPPASLIVPQAIDTQPGVSSAAANGSEVKQEDDIEKQS